MTGRPGDNPEMNKYAVEQATEALTSSIRNMLGVTPRGNVRAMAERVIRVYLKARAEDQFAHRMKASTVQISQMDVGDVIEVEASCKQNLHGQFKTVRKKLMNDQLKYRTEQIKDGLWRVERRADGSNNLGKAPERSEKAVWLAKIQRGKTKLRRDAKKPFQIINCNNKTRARAILGNPHADWSSKSVEGGVEVTRYK